MTTTCRRSGALAALLAATAVGVPACCGAITPNAATSVTRPSVGSGGRTTKTVQDEGQAIGPSLFASHVLVR